MIDWTKPIETVEDGQPARVLGLLALAMPSLPIEPDGPMMVWVKSDVNGLGNIFLVDNSGFRCDDRALFSFRQGPFIRNVKVKREGWVLMLPPVLEKYNPLPNQLATQLVYPSETDALISMRDCYAPKGTKPVYLTWEE
jgi:hypothetical protein